jgi:hypothetical protein
MTGYWTRLLVTLRALHSGRPASRRPRRCPLNVEKIEERDLLSASTVGIGLALPAAPLTSQSAAATGGDIALPERCIHGYKWRPPPWSYPRALNTGVTPATPPQPTFVASPSEPAAVVSALVPATAENTSIAIVAGHIVVNPPEGPLPSSGPTASI